MSKQAKRLAQRILSENSRKRGSLVVHLPMGDFLGEITDLRYFTKKLATLRIPLSRPLTASELAENDRMWAEEYGVAF